MPWSCEWKNCQCTKLILVRSRQKLPLKNWKRTFKNENTEKTTGYWVDVWNNYCTKEERFSEQIESYEPADHKKTLDRVFYAYSCRLTSNKNKQGDNYESKSLKVTTTALEGIKRTDIPVLKIGTGNSAPRSKFLEATSQTTASSWLRKAFKQSQVLLKSNLTIFSCSIWNLFALVCFTKSYNHIHPTGSCNFDTFGKTHSCKSIPNLTQSRHNHLYKLPRLSCVTF